MTVTRKIWSIGLNYRVIGKKEGGGGVSRMTLETNEQILHQMNIYLKL
jgi:hypothetical protein